MLIGGELWCVLARLICLGHGAALDPSEFGGEAAKPDQVDKTHRSRIPHGPSRAAAVDPFHMKNRRTNATRETAAILSVPGSTAAGISDP